MPCSSSSPSVPTGQGWHLGRRGRLLGRGFQRGHPQARGQPLRGERAVGQGTHVEVGAASRGPTVPGGNGVRPPAALLESALTRYHVPQSKHSARTWSPQAFALGNIVNWPQAAAWVRGGGGLYRRELCVCTRKFVFTFMCAHRKHNQKHIKNFALAHLTCPPWEESLFSRQNGPLVGTVRAAPRVPLGGVARRHARGSARARPRVSQAFHVPPEKPPPVWAPPGSSRPGVWAP